MRLAFPPYAIETRADGAGRPLVLDPVRQRWVRRTPEEWVRQHLLRYLLELGYPRGLLAVEKALAFAGQTWRADVVAYGRAGEALLLAECKAPGVAIGVGTFDQLARYNAALGARVLLVTNGLVHQCCVREAEGGGAGAWRFVEAVPPFGTVPPFGAG